MTEERAAVLRAVAHRIDALHRPARVAVDGVTASGKSMFTADLAALVAAPVARVQADDFHRPPSERHAAGEGPESYYRDTFDLTALRRAVEEAEGDAAAVLVDGVFLLRPELADLWDLTIFLAADRALALARALARDAKRMGGLAAARARYEARYVPGETIYLDAVDPESTADIVVEHTDPDQPRLLRPRS